MLNIAVRPGVGVQVKLHTIGAPPGRVSLDVRNYGDRYTYQLGAGPGHHPLLEAAIAEIGLPADVSVEISVDSEVPAGSSAGTSASTAVALIGALDALTPGRLTPRQLAYAAHRIETKRLKVQSGIQDQLCIAHGGINYIEISPYPDASVNRLSVPHATWQELERRIALVSLGRTHVSSALHDHVIAGLAHEGPSSPPLDELRRAAEAARNALLNEDLNAFGRAMIENTEAQRSLHPGLVGMEAETAIEVAASCGAVGWKVNGAGGNGGSLTVLRKSDADETRDLEHSLARADPGFEVIPTQLSSDGLRVWEGQI